MASPSNRDRNAGASTPHCPRAEPAAMTAPALPPHAQLHEAQRQLAAYRRRHPEEDAGLTALAAALARGDPAVLTRHDMRGHLTASALVVDPNTASVLMIHHRSLNRWLQPGGHVEAGESLKASARREAREETGLAAVADWDEADENGLDDGEMPLDIDTHAIPAHPAKGEAAHWHHDLLYLFRASQQDALDPALAEVHAARWMPLADMAALPEARFARLARKVAQRMAPGGTRGRPEAQP